MNQNFYLVPLGVIACVAGFALAKGSRAVDGSLGGDSGERSLESRLSAMTSSGVPGEVVADSEKISSIYDGEALRELWESYGNDARGQIGRQLVLERWAEIDPRGAYDYFEGDWQQARKVLVEWAILDPPGAAALLQDKGKYFGSIATDLAIRSPERGIEWIALWHEKDPPVYRSEQRATQLAFANLFAEDREKAMALAEALPEKQQADAFAGIAAAMARAGSAAALEWAEALENYVLRKAAIGAVAVEIAKSDPAAAVPLIKKYQDPMDHLSPGGTIVHNLARKGPRAAIDWISDHFETQAGHEGWVALNLVQYFWTQGEDRAIAAIAETSNEALRANLVKGLLNNTNGRDIGKMLAAAAAIGDVEIGQQMREPLVGMWAHSDLGAALHYVENLPAEQVTPELWGMVFDAAGTHGLDSIPDLFWENARQLPGDQQNRLIQGRLRSLAASQPAEAVAKLSELSDHPNYAGMAGQVADAWQQRDPVAAKEWIGTLEGEALGQAAGSFAYNEPTANARQTLAWLEALPLSDQQMNMAGLAIGRKWTSENGIESSAFIRELEEGPTRQGAIVGLVWESYRHDPAAALEWIGELRDAAVREEWQKKAASVLRSAERLGDR